MPSENLPMGLLGTNDASKSDVRHRAIFHLRLARRGTESQAVTRRTQMRPALDHAARHASGSRVRGIVAPLDRSDARIVDDTTRVYSRVVAVMVGCVEIARPLPHIAGYVEQTVAIRWKRTHWRHSFPSSGRQVPP